MLVDSATRHNPDSTLPNHPSTSPTTAERVSNSPPPSPQADSSPSTSTVQPSSSTLSPSLVDPPGSIPSTPTKQCSDSTMPAPSTSQANSTPPTPSERLSHSDTPSPTIVNQGFSSSSVDDPSVVCESCDSTNLVVEPRDNVNRLLNPRIKKLKDTATKQRPSRMKHRLSKHVRSSSEPPVSEQNTNQLITGYFTESAKRKHVTSPTSDRSDVKRAGVENNSDSSFESCADPNDFAHEHLYANLTLDKNK